MSRVSLDPDHLDGLAGSLGRYQDRLDGLLQQARSLGAGGDVAPLAGAPGWAGRTAPDLRRRAELVRRAERLRVPPAHWSRRGPVRAAASAAPLPPTVAAQVDELGRLDRLAEPGPYERLPGEGLQDWVTRVLGVMGSELVPLPAEVLTVVVDELLTYLDVTQAAATGVWATAGLTKLLTTQRLLTVGANGLTDLPLLRAVAPALAPVLDDVRMARIAKWVKDYGTVKVPGTLPTWLIGPLEKASGITPGLLTRALEGQGVAEVNKRVKALSALLGAGYAHTDEVARLKSLPALAGVSDKLIERLATTPRGATNLISVAADGGSVLKTAGALRMGGVVLQAGMTAVSIYDLTQIDHAEAWKNDKASLISDYAEAGFNASLTAAMVAPNPVTLTIAGVAGVIYVGTEVWDHWDEISDWATNGGPGRAVDAVEDFAGDVADGAKDLASGAADAVGDGVDAVKESKLNPFNWGD